MIVCGDLILIILSYGAFLLGWWLPFVASLLTLNLTALVGVIWGNRRRDRLKFQYILNLLLQEPNPLIRKIALEYFRQSESIDYTRRSKIAR